ncbi:MAG: hypothetical protein LQ344_001277 [Seirophora lacunosa]|nr:MAG: hypothetical protein LQ344_001277 [Seirophora lacunosa]
MPAAPERLPHLQKMVEHLRDAQEPLRHLQQLVEMARDAPSPVVAPTPVGVMGDMILGTLMLVIALRRRTIRPIVDQPNPTQNSGQQTTTESSQPDQTPSHAPTSAKAWHIHLRVHIHGGPPRPAHGSPVHAFLHREACAPTVHLTIRAAPDQARPPAAPTTHHHPVGREQPAAGSMTSPHAITVDVVCTDRAGIDLAGTAVVSGLAGAANDPPGFPQAFRPPPSPEPRMPVSRAASTASGSSDDAVLHTIYTPDTDTDCASRPASPERRPQPETGSTWPPNADALLQSITEALHFLGVD